MDSPHKRPAIVPFHKSQDTLLHPGLNDQIQNTLFTEDPHETRALWGWFDWLPGSAYADLNWSALVNHIDIHQEFSLGFDVVVVGCMRCSWSEIPAFICFSQVLIFFSFLPRQWCCWALWSWAVRSAWQVRGPAEPAIQVGILYSLHSCAFPLDVVLDESSGAHTPTSQTLLRSFIGQWNIAPWRSYWDYTL